MCGKAPRQQETVKLGQTRASDSTGLARCKFGRWMLRAAVPVAGVILGHMHRASYSKYLYRAEAWDRKHETQARPHHKSRWHRLSFKIDLCEASFGRIFVPSPHSD